MSMFSSDDNSNMNEAGAPYQLLEINMISAQELAQVSKSVRAYAVAWLHPDRKLGTQVDEDGHTNPTWNEKFVFRVDEHIHTDAVIMIEIYSQSRLRHILIGSVAVRLSDLLPPNRKQKLRFVALQIRSPSGHPQGILNIGVNLLDPTLRSMPLYSELTPSDVNSSENNTTITKTQDSSVFMLQRCQSEKNDSTVNDYPYEGKNNKHYGYDGESDSDLQKAGVFNEGSLISDVGPSPSIVAAAIAKGLYPMPPPPRTVESTTMDGWSETTGNEVIKNKCEKWRNELTPAYEDSYPKKMRQTPKRTYGDSDDRRNKRQTPRRVSQTRDRRAGPVSCFGSVFGLEVTISCGGGGNRSKSKRRGTAASSELTFDDSYI